MEGGVYWRAAFNGGRRLMAFIGFIRRAAFIRGRAFILIDGGV